MSWEEKWGIALLDLHNSLSLTKVKSNNIVKYQHAYSPHWSPYIPCVTNEENLFSNQDLLLADYL